MPEKKGGQGESKMTACISHDIYTNIHFHLLNLIKNILNFDYKVNIATINNRTKSLKLTIKSNGLFKNMMRCQALKLRRKLSFSQLVLQI